MANITEQTQEQRGQDRVDSTSNRRNDQRQTSTSTRRNEDGPKRQVAESIQEAFETRSQQRSTPDFTLSFRVEISGFDPGTQYAV
jgi:hypothetical protein